MHRFSTAPSPHHQPKSFFFIVSAPRSLTSGQLAPFMAVRGAPGLCDRLRNLTSIPVHLIFNKGNVASPTFELCPAKTWSRIGIVLTRVPAGSKLALKTHFYYIFAWTGPRRSHSDVPFVLQQFPCLILRTSDARSALSHCLLPCSSSSRSVSTLVPSLSSSFILSGTRLL